MDHKQTLDHAIGDAPPSTIDINSVVARQRRAIRFRRAVAAFGTVTLAGIVLTVGVTISGGTPLKEQVGNAPHVPTSTPTYVAPTNQATFDLAESARLTPVLQTTVRDLLPAAEQTSNQPGVGALEVFPERAVGARSDTPAPYFASANLQDDLGTGYVLVSVGFDTPNWGVDNGSSGYVVGPNPGYIEDCTLQPGGTADHTCQESIGPNGERMVITTERYDNGAVQLRVDVVKPDRTVTIVETGNWKWGLNGRSGVPDRAQPPLTVHQILDVALNPAVTFYP